MDMDLDRCKLKKAVQLLTLPFHKNDSKSTIRNQNLHK